jgi:molybdate transport system substrate-binding protein
MTLVSEILPAKGVQLVGPLPADVQHYVNFAAGISATNKDANAAKRLMKFLASPAAGPALKSMGMEPPR